MRAISSGCFVKVITKISEVRTDSLITFFAAFHFICELNNPFHSFPSCLRFHSYLIRRRSNCLELTFFRPPSFASTQLNPPPNFFSCCHAHPHLRCPQAFEFTWR